MVKNLGLPSCHMGYPIRQLEKEMGDEFEELLAWFYGQTVAICAGATCAEPHGLVIYEWDVERFLLGLPIID